jgi:hypothetical protein
MGGREATASTPLTANDEPKRAIELVFKASEFRPLQVLSHH